MQLTIRGEKLDVTPAIRTYIEEKLEKIERYFEPNAQASGHVNLKVHHKKAQKVEVTILLAGLVLRAEDTNQDLYAAVDLVVDKLERQIRKHKTKVNRKSREKGHITLPFTELTYTIEPEEEETLITRTKQFELVPMTPDEAILQMNLIGHTFYIFLDGDTGKTCVVYRRSADTYGLIETN